MRFWWCDPGLKGGAAERASPTMDKVFALESEQITWSPLSQMPRVECEGRRYYVKQYAGNGNSVRRRWCGLRQWLAPPRVKKEWQNLRSFQLWGIPTARLAAYGIERRCGGFRRGALITDGDVPTVYLIDCPSGGYWWGPFLQYRIVKDLACLDKLAKYHLTRTQRLRFFLDYVQRRRLTEADRKRVRKIIGFFEGRE